MTTENKKGLQSKNEDKSIMSIREFVRVLRINYVKFFSMKNIFF